MAENSKIEWTHHTFNPWVGCTKVSPACDHCYAEGWAKRSGMVQWGAHAERRRTTESNWRQPLKWNAEAERLGVRYRVFCASLADVFDNAVPAQWRADLFRLIAETPNLDWLLLTKRIGNVASMLGDYKTVPLLPNIWIGASIVNQEEADRDIPKLMRVRAVKRFLSMEPLLGAVDLSQWLDIIQYEDGAPWGRRNIGQLHDMLDWVIVGGESGTGARPMHTAWAQALRDQCHAAGVPFLFKQWGEWREPLAGEEFDTSMGRAAKPPAFILSETGTVHCFENERIVNGKAVIKVGKKTAGRLLDGREWNEVPTC
jgi:protein gp37